MKYCVLLLLFLLSCKGNTNKESGCESAFFSESTEFLAVNIADVKEEIEIPLSELVESLDVIPLENKEEAIVKIQYIDVSDNYIGITPAREGSYRLFDRRGKYICSVGAVGQGPGEFTALYSSQLDEVAGKVYLYPYDAKKILAYDLQGKYLDSESIPLPSILTKSKGFIDSKEKKVTIAILPFKGEDHKGVCWVQNFKGEILQSVPAEGYEVIPDYSNDVLSYQNTSSFDFRLSKFIQEKQDTLYHYNVIKNCLEPVLTLNAPMDPGKIIYGYLELNRYFMISINKIDYNKKSDTDIGSTRLILVDKETHEAHYVQVVNDFLGGIKMDPFYLSFHMMNGYYAFAMEPVELKEQLEQVIGNKELKGDMKERVEKLYNSLNVNDNNIVMIGKLK